MTNSVPPFLLDMEEDDEWMNDLPFSQLSYTPYGTFHTVSPFVATGSEVSKSFISLASLTNEDVMLDLGCGVGSVVMTVLEQVRQIYRYRYIE